MKETKTKFLELHLRCRAGENVLDRDKNPLKHERENGKLDIKIENFCSSDDITKVVKKYNSQSGWKYLQSRAKNFYQLKYLQVPLS